MEFTREFTTMRESKEMITIFLLMVLVIIPLTIFLYPAVKEYLDNSWY